MDLSEILPSPHEITTVGFLLKIATPERICAFESQITKTQTCTIGVTAQDNFRGCDPRRAYKHKEVMLQ